jgi:hypothetical protein
MPVRGVDESLRLASCSMGKLCWSRLSRSKDPRSGKGEDSRPAPPMRTVKSAPMFCYVLASYGCNRVAMGIPFQQQGLREGEVTSSYDRRDG